MGKTKHLVFMLAILLVAGCTKRADNLQDYLPQVEMISAVVTPEGQIEVRARLISVGPRGLNFIGFCADSVPNPDIDKNQILVSELYGDEFVATIGDAFLPGTYSHMYVNAFAANNFAYNTAIPIYLDSTASVGFRPEVSAPCEVEMNQVLLNQNGNYQTYTNISPVDTSGGISTFTATVNNYQKVRFSFKDLDQKVFTTATSLQDIDVDKMLITVIQNGIEYTVSPGQDVYVIRVENYTFDIVTCGLPWGFAILKTRVRVSL